MKEIVVTSTGIGNILSVSSHLQQLGFDVEIIPIESFNSHSVDDRPVVIAGVAALYDSIKISDVKKNLLTLVDSGRKILGICAGYQIAFRELSESDGSIGLQLDDRNVEPLNVDLKTSIGMKEIYNPTDKLIGRAYLCHTYGVEFQENNSNDHAYYKIGKKKILAIFKTDQFLGLQFHPEKSPNFSNKLLIDFLT